VLVKKFHEALLMKGICCSVCKDQYGNLQKDSLFCLIDEKPVIVVLDVIPAKAGIQYFNGFLDSRLRGSDGFFALFSRLLENLTSTWSVLAWINKEQGNDV